MRLYSARVNTKEKGRLLILGEELDKQVREYLL